LRENIFNFKNKNIYLINDNKYNFATGLGEEEREGHETNYSTNISRNDAKSRIEYRLEFEIAKTGVDHAGM